MSEPTWEQRYVQLREAVVERAESEATLRSAILTSLDGHDLTRALDEVTELKVRARAATIALERLLAEPMGEFDLTHSPPPDAAGIIQPETKPPRPALGDPKRWITVDEAASFFGCSRRTIEKLLHRHAIPTLRIGRLVRIDLPGAEEALLKTRLGA